jgi:hypothetical protein
LFDNLIRGGGVIARPIGRPALSQIANLAKFRLPEAPSVHEVFKLFGRRRRALLGDIEVARDPLRRHVGRIEKIAEIAFDLPVQGEGRMRRKQTDNKSG